MTLQYVGDYGADTGGGFAESFAADPLTRGQYIVGADTWGMRVTTTYGNEWWGCMANISDGNRQHGRTSFFSKRPETAGLRFFGTGTNSSGGALCYGLPGTFSLVTFDSGTQFNLGLTSNSGPNSFARRACGQLIDSWVDSDANHTEYIFTLNRSGVKMFVNGSTVATISGRASAIVKPTTPLCGTTEIGDQMRQFIEVIDQKHIVVINSDHTIAGGVSGGPQTSDVYLVTTSATNWAGATAANTTAAKLTIPPPAGRVYEIHRGKDSELYAAAGYDGVYHLTFTGSNFTWAKISGALADNLVCTVDATSTGVVWAGQAGGTNYNNDQSIAAGHSIIKISGGTPTWGAPTANINFNEFQPNDGLNATGRTWWIAGRNIVLGAAAHDCSMLRVDPFDDNRIMVTGRAGHWQTRDSGANWNPAVRGMNGGQLISGGHTRPAGTSIRCTGGNNVVFYNDDYFGGSSTNATLTCLNASNYVGGAGGALINSPSFSYTGITGAKYVFKAATAGNPATLTKDGFPIHDDRFQGAVVFADSITETADGTVIITQDGGGCFCMRLQNVVVNGGSTNFPLPPTDDGQLHVGLSMQFGIGNVPTLANAQLLADTCDLITVNNNELAGFETDMIKRNSDLRVDFYTKGQARATGSDPAVPDKFHEHDVNGVQIVKPASGPGNPQVMVYQTDAVNATAITTTDALNNGVSATGNSWRTWHTDSCIKKLNLLRAGAQAPAGGVDGANIYAGWMNDSQGTFQYVNGTAVNPKTGTAYSSANGGGIPAWLDMVYQTNRAQRTYVGTITPEGVPAQNTNKYMVHSNGMSPMSSSGVGDPSPTPSDEQKNCATVDIVSMEGGLFNAATSNPTAQMVENEINAIIKSQENCAITTLEKPWGGGTVADHFRARRYAAAAVMLGNRGSALFDYTRASGAVPWPVTGDAGEYQADPDLYNISLGSPRSADSPTFTTGGNPANLMRMASGLYRRRYDPSSLGPGGVVLINPTAAAINYPADRAYQGIQATGAPTFANGSNISVPANSAMFLYVQVNQGIPSNTTLPTISGTAQQGQTLTKTSDGVWSGAAPITFAYQWQRFTAGAWANIATATGATYVLAAADVGLTVRLQVTASNGIGTTTAASVATGTVAPTGGNAPSNTVAPSITGSPVRVNTTLSAVNGTWTGDAPITFTYQWFRIQAGGSVLVGTAATYILVAADLGKTIQLTVTASNAISLATAQSAAVGPVVEVVPLCQTLPALSTTAPVVGVPISTTTGVWTSIAPPVFTYQWMISTLPTTGYSNISGATTNTYTPVSGDTGMYYQCRVTATNSGGSNTFQSNQTTTPVAGGISIPSNTVAPSITGTAQASFTLTADHGTWTDSPSSYAYQWQQDAGTSTWTDIAGATLVTFGLTATQVGQNIRVRVKATNSAGPSTFVNSASVGLVTPAPVAQPPHNTGLPVITGVAQTGNTLTASRGAWSNSPSSFAFQWQRSTAIGYVNIAGANAASYLVISDDVGTTLQCLVTAANSVGPSTVTTAPTITVIFDPASTQPEMLRAPAIVGTPIVGKHLIVDPGDWLNAERFTFQWQISKDQGSTFKDIPNATTTKYTPTLSDISGELRVRVTAYPPGS